MLSDRAKARRGPVAWPTELVCGLYVLFMVDLLTCDRPGLAYTGRLSTMSGSEGAGYLRSDNLVRFADLVTLIERSARGRLDSSASSIQGDYRGAARAG